MERPIPAGYDFTPETLSSMQEALGHRFRSLELLCNALVHSSAREEGLPCNERMEFLGDAILGLVVSEYLYAHFAEYEEGQLSSVKSVVVSCSSLARQSERLGVGEAIRLGKGINRNKPLPDSVLGNAFEALVAAIYLDSGLEPARRFILVCLEGRIREVVEGRTDQNYKSILQHFTQKKLGCVPLYKVSGERGPDHLKWFEIVVHLQGTSYGPGTGRTKKDAEQQAARIALEALEVLPQASAAPAAGPPRSAPAPVAESADAPDDSVGPEEFVNNQG